MIKSHMLDEIREQPMLLDRVEEQMQQHLQAEFIREQRFQRLHFLGCGDMDFAARSVAWLSRGGGIPVLAHRSMEMRWQAEDLGPDDLVVAASFSGRTPRTIEAARLCRARGALVLGLTGNSGSPICQALDRTWVLRTGREDLLTRHAYSGYHYNVPQTKTYTAMVRAELAILESLGLLSVSLGEALKKPGQRLTADLARLEEGIDRFMDKGFRPVNRVAVLGSGPWRPSADFGKAKCLEMALLARSQCLEENNHLEMFVTDSEELQVLLAPDQASWSRARELIEPYARFQAPVLVLVPASLSGEKELLVQNGESSFFLSLPEATPPLDFFQVTFALQLLAAALGPALGRDIDQWVGGVRTGLIEELGQTLVRGSDIRGKTSKED